MVQGRSVLIKPIDVVPLFHLERPTQHASPDLLTNNANTASNKTFAGNHSATRGAGSLNGGKEAAVLFFSEPTMDKRKEHPLDAVHYGWNG